MTDARARIAALAAKFLGQTGKVDAQATDQARNQRTGDETPAATCPLTEPAQSPGARLAANRAAARAQRQRERASEQSGHESDWSLRRRNEASALIKRFNALVCSPRRALFELRKLAERDQVLAGKFCRMLRSAGWKLQSECAARALAVLLVQLELAKPKKWHPGPRRPRRSRLQSLGATLGGDLNLGSRVSGYACGFFKRVLAGPDGCEPHRDTITDLLNRLRAVKLVQAYQPPWRTVMPWERSGVWAFNQYWLPATWSTRQKPGLCDARLDAITLEQWRELVTAYTQQSGAPPPLC